MPTGKVEKDRVAAALCEATKEEQASYTSMISQYASSATSNGRTSSTRGETSNTCRTNSNGGTSTEHGTNSHATTCNSMHNKSDQGFDSKTRLKESSLTKAFSNPNVQVRHGPQANSPVGRISPIKKAFSQSSLDRRGTTPPHYHHVAAARMMQDNVSPGSLTVANSNHSIAASEGSAGVSPSPVTVEEDSFPTSHVP